MIYCCSGEPRLCSLCICYMLGWRRGLHWGIFLKHEMVIALRLVCVWEAEEAANWNFVFASIDSSRRLVVVAPHSQSLPRITILSVPRLPPPLTPSPSNFFFSFFTALTSKWRQIPTPPSSGRVPLLALALLLRFVLTNQSDWCRPHSNRRAAQVPALAPPRAWDTHLSCAGLRVSSCQSAVLATGPARSWFTPLSWGEGRWAQNGCLRHCTVLLDKWRWLYFNERGDWKVPEEMRRKS